MRQCIQYLVTELFPAELPEFLFGLLNSLVASDNISIAGNIKQNMLSCLWIFLSLQACITVLGL